jgi:hypothetical protein
MTKYSTSSPQLAQYSFESAAKFLSRRQGEARCPLQSIIAYLDEVVKTPTEWPRQKNASIFAG